MSFKISFLKNLATVGFYTYSHQLIKFGISLALVRILSPEEYGLYAIILIFTGFLVLFADLGLSYAVLRDDNENNEKEIDGAMPWIGLFQMLILILITYPVTVFYGKSELFWPMIFFSLSFISMSFGIVPKTILRKKLLLATLGKIQVLSTLLAGLIAILTALSGFSLWALVFQEFVFILVSSFLFRYISKIKFQFLPLRRAWVTLKLNKSLIQGISGFNFVNYFSRNTDKFLLGKFYGEVVLGLYSRAYSFIFFVLGIVGSVCMTFLFPSLKEIKDDPVRFSKEMSFIINLLALFTIPLSFFLILFPKMIVSVLWGDKWFEVIPYLPYFGIVLLMQVQTFPIGELFILKRREITFLKMGIVNATVIVGFTIFGVLISPISTAFYYTIGTLITYSIVFIWGYKSILTHASRELIFHWLINIVFIVSLLISLDDSFYLYWIFIFYSITHGIKLLPLLIRFYRKV